ncbi:L-2-hydroxyglutarate oxidase [Fulvivirga sedimenti]|uniref:L-2-hydroxyglutarate oxidase n=1 Tax=Fulvivirga sedimenti TaxID=2879465 RepID=A0A9X1KZG3_9BACT|nr:L-2-hydroxyglutarate oxidase [Fulvivirga sedimenti]
MRDLTKNFVNDIVIIGAGIVGLATAYTLKKKHPGLRISIVEKESGIATHQTGHNSGVIHSGLYYKPGSLKATNCIRGYQMLVNFARENEIPFELCGKVVVATKQEQVPLMETLFQRGVRNGLRGMKRLTVEELREYEPHVNGVAGIHVPQTGIIDYSVVAGKMAQLFQEKGGEIHLGNKVNSIIPKEKYSIIETSEQSIETKLVVNCAGLYSDKVAAFTEQKMNVKIIPFRGEYFDLVPDKQHLVKNLIYPVPDPNFPFLGVHFTRMINGGVEAGPNAVLAFRREGYKKLDVDWPELKETLAWPGFQKVAAKYWKTGMGEMYRSFSKAAFTKALQGLIPEIQASDLIPGGAGVRAQACDKKGGLIDDFLIMENKYAINVCNAPSPAATSSLSIGEILSERVLKRFPDPVAS